MGFNKEVNQTTFLPIVYIIILQHGLLNNLSIRAKFTLGLNKTAKDSENHLNVQVFYPTDDAIFYVN